MQILAKLFSVSLSISLMMAGQAFAGTDENAAEWNPPARFDHPYSGKMTVIYLPQKQVPRACAKLFDDSKVIAMYSLQGCSAITSKTSCTVIVINKTYKLATPKAIVRHETGHCNGWPSNHPN